MPGCDEAETQGRQSIPDHATTPLIHGSHMTGLRSSSKKLKNKIKNHRSGRLEVECPHPAHREQSCAHSPPLETDSWTSFTHRPVSTVHHVYTPRYRIWFSGYVSYECSATRYPRTSPTAVSKTLPPTPPLQSLAPQFITPPHHLANPAGSSSSYSLHSPSLSNDPRHTSRTSFRRLYSAVSFFLSSVVFRRFCRSQPAAGRSGAG